MTNLTPNQIVAFNLRRARRLHGWRQDKAAEQLAPFLGKHWSNASFSAAEKSVEHPERIKVFSADEIVAFAAAFELPVAYFFEPPADVQAIAAPGATRELSPTELQDVRGPLPKGPVKALEKAYLKKLERKGIEVRPEPAKRKRTGKKK